jgi:hypothetical protein
VCCLSRRSRSVSVSSPSSLSPACRARALASGCFACCCPALHEPRDRHDACLACSCSPSYLLIHPVAL